jgi:PAS domain S-box-containing protein
MSRIAALRLAFTLALMFAFGFLSVRTAPDSVHYGAMWPTGLAAGALLLAPRTLAPYIGALIALLGAASFALGGYPVAVSIGYGVGVAAEATIAHQMLTSGWTRRVYLRDNSDFLRFVIACAAGAVTGAVVFTVVSALTDFGTPWKVGLITLETHAATLVVLLGIFKAPAHEVSEYGRSERWAAWVITIVVGILAFIPQEMPSLAFLVIPGLGWVALRAPMREAMVQLVVVGVIASTLTSLGLGPFADADLTQHLDPELISLPLQVFLITCAMVTIPFSMTVGRQRRNAAAVLMERARIERLVQSARGIAIIGTDELGRINLFSPGAELILGYTPAEVFGHSTRLFHTQAEIARQAEDLGCEPTYIDVVRTTAKLPPGTPREWEFVRKDGTPRWLSLILSPIIDENGAFTGYVATADDVTDRLDTQAALEAALVNEREAVERLIEIDKVKDRFVSSVSHELRTPITNIVGYLELLMDGVYGVPSDDQARAMSRIEMNSRRLLTLIDDLLTLSRMETGNPAELTPVDLVTVVRRAEDIVRPGLMRRDLELALDLPDHEVVIDGDAGQLERLVINLATNAVKFTLDGGRVTLRVLAPENGTGPVIEVEDTGIGIPAADQEMLFSRFFRATQAREAAVPGSGLGLSIAKSIAEVHGGQISAVSVVGSGSTFRVDFPSARERSDSQR